MKIDVDEERNIRLREVFNGVKLETSEGNAIGVCMRDDTLEINVMPGGKHTGNWWRVNMQTGDIDPMPNAPAHPRAEKSRGEAGCSQEVPRG